MGMFSNVDAADRLMLAVSVPVAACRYLGELANEYLLPLARATPDWPLVVLVYLGVMKEAKITLRKGRRKKNIRKSDIRALIFSIKQARSKKKEEPRNVRFYDPLGDGEAFTGAFEGPQRLEEFDAGVLSQVLSHGSARPTARRGGLLASVIGKISEGDRHTYAEKTRRGAAVEIGGVGLDGAKGLDAGQKAHAREPGGELRGVSAESRAADIGPVFDARGQISRMGPFRGNRRQVS